MIGGFISPQLLQLDSAPKARLGSLISVDFYSIFRIF